jgi:putative transposase
MIVERHNISGTPELIRLCGLSKELYNKCNFLMRQAWFSQKRLPDINILVEATKNFDCFKNLHNTKTAKQTIRRILSDWSNFKKALNAYQRDPSKFVKNPKPPYYKEKLAQVTFYQETIARKPLRNGVITPTNGCFFVKSEVKNFKQVVVTPKTFGFIVEVQYEQVEKQNKGGKIDKNKVCCIDIGVNNLCAVTSDQHHPILVNGHIVKSFNRWYNMNPCKSRSKKRYFRIENYFHHVSKMIIENCVKHDIGKIIIGKNNGWKQNVKMGKVQKQNFQDIPFVTLLNKIKYKAAAEGIEVIFTEEAYTSKASYLDRDQIPAWKKNQTEPEFSGIRVKRGLYRSKDGTLLNADVNGSANIGRKVIQDEEFLLRLDRSLAARPVVINPLRKSIA